MPLDCACRGCSVTHSVDSEQSRRPGISPSRWHTVVNSVRPCEHEIVQTMADVTAPPVAPCACHYNTASVPLSPQQSHLPIYHAGEYSFVAAWPSLLGNLRCQSLVLVSTHLLQPSRPLLSSLRCQSVPQSFEAWPPSAQQSRIPVSRAG